MGGDKTLFSSRSSAVCWKGHFPCTALQAALVLSGKTRRGDGRERISVTPLSDPPFQLSRLLPAGPERRRFATHSACKSHSPSGGLPPHMTLYRHPQMFYSSPNDDSSKDLQDHSAASGEWRSSRKGDLAHCFTGRPALCTCQVLTAAASCGSRLGVQYYICSRKCQAGKSCIPVQTQLLRRALSKRERLPERMWEWSERRLRMWTLRGRSGPRGSGPLLSALSWSQRLFLTT